MPTTWTDPAVAAASVKLKLAQERMVNLRREHMEHNFARVDEVKALVVKLGAEFKALAVGAPSALRRALPDLISFEAEDQVYDVLQAYFSAGIDKALSRFNPAPAQPSAKVYIDKPGPHISATRAKQKQKVAKKWTASAPK